jgi:hypothetical protein
VSLNPPKCAGKALRDTPVIQDVLQAISNATLHRADVQIRVDQASNAVRTIVRCAWPAGQERRKELSVPSLFQHSHGSTYLLAHAHRSCPETRAANELLRRPTLPLDR